MKCRCAPSLSADVVWSQLDCYSILMLTPLTTVGRSAFRAKICDCNSSKFGSLLFSRSSPSDGLRLTYSIKINIVFSWELRKEMFSINLCGWFVCVFVCKIWFGAVTYDVTDSIVKYIFKFFFFANLLMMGGQMLRIHQKMLMLMVLMLLLLQLLMVMVWMMRWFKFHFMIGHTIIFERVNWIECWWYKHSVNVHIRLVLHHIRLHVFVWCIEAVAHN